MYDITEITNAVTDAFAFGWILSGAYLMILSWFITRNKFDTKMDAILMGFIVVWLITAAAALIM